AGRLAPVSSRAPRAAHFPPRAGAPRAASRAPPTASRRAARREPRTSHRERRAARLPPTCPPGTLESKLLQGGPAMDAGLREFAEKELEQIREQGLFKEEWPILGPQGPEIRVEGRSAPVLNFCANNYLGLASHPELAAAARKTIDEWGYGL